MKTILGFKDFVNESINESLKFKDLKIGDEFLRFGENGQLWKKINRSQAEFIKNVGKQTAKSTMKSGTLNTFPSTVDVTLNESSQHINVNESQNLTEEIEVSDLKSIKSGDTIVIKNSDVKGPHYNTPITFLKYDKIWNWIVAKDKDGKTVKVGIEDNPQNEPYKIIKEVNEGVYKKEGWLVKSNDNDTKYIVVHTSEVENKSNRISDIYKDKKLADKRAVELNKKLRDIDEAISVDTSRYERSHGKKPRGKGGWAFYLDDPKIHSPIFSPSRLNYSDAVTWAKEKAKKDGKTLIWVAESIALDESEHVNVKLTVKSASSFEKELKNNKISYTKESPTTFSVEKTPKSMMAIKLTKERFGTQNIIVENSNFGLLAEGVWSKIMLGVKKGDSGPWTIVAIQNNKVVGQKIDIKFKDLIPAHYEDMKRKFSNAKIHIEDSGGQVVWSEK